MLHYAIERKFLIDWIELETISDCKTKKLSFFFTRIGNNLNKIIHLKTMT